VEKECVRVHEPSAQILTVQLRIRLFRFLSNLMRRGKTDGFTLLELVVTVAIIGSLSSIAIPNYMQQIENARIARATGEIRVLEKEILTYHAANQVYPNSLDDIGRGGLKDPWGNPYEYVDLTSIEGKDKARKDHFLVPINTDFDLYSKGRDGDSTGPLTAKASQDDIIRAGDGQYVGIAEAFSVAGKSKEEKSK
jgi:general secretion pathway protein G